MLTLPAGSVLWLWQVIVREFESEMYRWRPEDEAEAGVGGGYQLYQENGRWEEEEEEETQLGKLGRKAPPRWSWSSLVGVLVHQPVVCSVVLFLAGCALNDVISVVGWCVCGYFYHLYRVRHTKEKFIFCVFCHFPLEP